MRDWTTATLTEDGVKAETIEKAVEILWKGEVDGAALLQLSAADLECWGIPGGPAVKLASRVRGLKAEKDFETKRPKTWFFLRNQKFIH